MNAHAEKVITRLHFSTAFLKALVVSKTLALKIYLPINIVSRDLQGNTINYKSEPCCFSCCFSESCKSSSDWECGLQSSLSHTPGPKTTGIYTNSFKRNWSVLIDVVNQAVTLKKNFQWNIIFGFVFYSGRSLTRALIRNDPVESKFLFSDIKYTSNINYFYFLDVIVQGHLFSTKSVGFLSFHFL